MWLGCWQFISYNKLGEINIEVLNFEFKEKNVPYIINDNGCYECTYKSHSESGHIYLKIHKKKVFAHRYVYEQIYGKILPGFVIRHKCDNPKCINPAHLLLGSHADNVADRCERGRSANGEKNGRSKLKIQQVKEIKYIQSLTTTELAKIYNVSCRSIKKIKDNDLWKDVTV